VRPRWLAALLAVAVVATYARVAGHELLDYDDPPNQLENLLRLCEAQRHSVIYLDKLDKALDRWREKPGQSRGLEERLEAWLERAKTRLRDDECTVVFTGRAGDSVPTSLASKFDKALCVQG